MKQRQRQIPHLRTTKELDVHAVKLRGSQGQLDASGDSMVVNDQPSQAAEHASQQMNAFSRSALTGAFGDAAIAWTRGVSIFRDQVTKHPHFKQAEHSEGVCAFFAERVWKFLSGMMPKTADLMDTKPEATQSAGEQEGKVATVADQVVDAASDKALELVEHKGLGASTLMKAASGGAGTAVSATMAIGHVLEEVYKEKDDLLTAKTMTQVVHQMDRLGDRAWSQWKSYIGTATEAQVDQLSQTVDITRPIVVPADVVSYCMQLYVEALGHSEPARDYVEDIHGLPRAIGQAIGEGNDRYGRDYFEGKTR